MPPRTIVTIGNFDGVHLGHAALVREARRLAGPADQGGRVVALAFHPHPISTLRPAEAPAMLTDFDQRATMLRALGADQVVRLEPTAELLALTPEQFVERVIREHGAQGFVEGEDFRFGKGRAGDVELLRDMARARGFDASILPAVTVDLTDQTLVACSSSLARWLVSRGRVADAARVLGRPYELRGVVVRGDQRGRQIGFPTANLDTPCLPPADGVYAARAQLPDGRLRPAAVHVGPRATFENAARTVEASILDWQGPLIDGWDGAAEYGWALTIRFVAWLRDPAKFESVRALVGQITRDVERARILTRDDAHPHDAGPLRAEPCAARPA